jgi:hypothetical protein
MIYKGLNRIGMIGDIKTNGGGEIAEVYGGIGESDPIYYKQREMVGTSPMQFKALGLPLKDYRIYGETLKDGTPSPDMPVDVVGCGEWDSAANSYKLPVTTTNGTDTVTTPIYIGFEPLHRIGEYADYVGYSSGKIMRRIKKLVLTGEENWYSNHLSKNLFNIDIADYVKNTNATICLCTHYKAQKNITLWTNVQDKSVCFYDSMNSLFYLRDSDFSTVADFKSYLAAQYAAGTPVTVWYVLQEPIEEDPPVPFPELPTLSGTNTLTVDTAVKPSEIDLTGRLKTSG